MKLVLGASKLIGMCVLVASLAAPSVTSAAMMTYGFNNIAPNNATNATNGEAQLFVEVIEVGGAQVKFKFRNVGLLAMSITDVYFDDGSLLGISSVAEDSGAGVSYSVNADPGNLPGGNTVNFNTTKGFSADSVPAVEVNGVNPGEWLVVLFNLQSGKSYTDVIAAISLSLANPGVDKENGLRIGIHVQAFGNGGSEAFVNGPVVPDLIDPIVPEPGTMAMWALGLALCGSGRMWRKRRSNAA